MKHLKDILIAIQVIGLIALLSFVTANYKAIQTIEKQISIMQEQSDIQQQEIIILEGACLN